MAGASSKALASACDEFVTYDALPGIPVFEPAPSADGTSAPKKRTRRTKASAGSTEPPDPQAAATGLLTRALRIGMEKDDDDWPHDVYDTGYHV